MYRINREIFAEFENQVILTLTQIKENMEQHSLLLTVITSVKSNDCNTSPPNNVPKFPIKTQPEFQEFEDLLKKDSFVCEYLVG